MVTLQLLAEGCRLVSPVLEDTLHCIIVSRDSLEQNGNDENKDEYHRLTGVQKVPGALSGNLQTVLKNLAMVTTTTMLLVILRACINF